MRRTRLLIVLLIAAGFAVVPYRIDLLDPKRLSIEPSMAAAKSGKGSGGSDDEGDDEDDDEEDDEEDDDEDDEEGNSGSGSGGNSGPGGSGGGNSGAGGAGGGNGSVSPDGGIVGGVFRSNGIVQRIEVSSRGIEIRYSDGFREEISNGIYKVRDGRGRTILRRAARGSDVARLKAVASRVSIRSVVRSAPTRNDVQTVDRSGDGVSVFYSNGWREHVAGNSYRLIDPFNRTVVVRVATRSDRDRLRDLSGGN